MSRPKLTTLNKKSVIASITALTILILGLIFIYVSKKNAAAPQIQTINYSQLTAMVQKNLIAEANVEGETFTVKTKENLLAKATIPSEVAQQTLIQSLEKSGTVIDFKSLKPSNTSLILSWLFPLAVMLIGGVVVWRLYATLSGTTGDFNLSDTQGTQTVTFDDVAGVDEAKQELSEMIDFLKNPIAFGRLGGRAPKGILLSGPPGTGKTLLAKAAANEAKVPFLSVSGSSFQEKFAGLGAARVRKLFAEARKLSPCVIFIDEIDALGRSRGRGGDAATADQDQTLNQLLVELDGFSSITGIVVIASTNRPDILDQALTRPGRFDREIIVNLADARGREAILNVHAKKITFAESLDLQWIARGTPGFSGADLENLLNESAIAATRDGSLAVERKHVEYARDKILMGAERQGFLMDEQERFITAVHEAGHVAVGVNIENGDHFACYFHSAFDVV